MKGLEEKYKKLQGIIAQYKKAIVAFSGGVDSTFLLKVVHDVLGKNVLAVTAVSPAYAKKDRQEALAFVQEHDIPHRTVQTKEFSQAIFLQNSPDRCYHCKTALYQKLRSLAQAEGYDAVLDGSNLDDETDYRPGFRAVQEQAAVCPLKLAGLNKNDIRELSKKLGLKTYNKVASPCLSSRFPYGVAITPERMEQVEKAEELLREAGVPLCRVRYHGEIARIEVAPADLPRLAGPGLRERIVQGLKGLGFKYVTLDLQGFRSGSLNEALSEEQKRKYNPPAD